MNMFPHKLQQSENNRRPGIKAIKDYINKNFVTDAQEELIEGIVMELLGHNIIENRRTPKGISSFIRKKNKTPIDVITLESQNTPVIRSITNMLFHSDGISNRYNK